MLAKMREKVWQTKDQNQKIEDKNGFKNIETTIERCSSPGFDHGGGRMKGEFERG